MRRAFIFVSTELNARRWKVDKEILEDRIVVIYTGEPRNSGTNNWEITKRHIDGDRELFDIFEGIRDSSLDLRDALKSGDWDRAGEILKAAHPERQRLSPNITTPQMDVYIEKAIKHGAIGTKICGAGGGGCIAFFCAEGTSKKVAAALQEENEVEVLRWKLSEQGLEISET